MTSSYPKVAFVDDIEAQIKPLESAVTSFNQNFVFFDPSPGQIQPPEPYNSVKLLFLDLYYSSNFDAELCAQWVSKIIVKGNPYYLVIWSKDTQHTQNLLQILEEIELLPVLHEEWQKTDFLGAFDFAPLLSKFFYFIANPEFQHESFLGEILEVDDDGVLVNCCLDRQQPTFQVRKFDRVLFENIKDVKNGSFVRLNFHSKPGVRLMDVFIEYQNHAELFITPDFFGDIGSSAFFIED